MHLIQLRDSAGHAAYQRAASAQLCVKAFIASALKVCLSPARCAQVSSFTFQVLTSNLKLQTSNPLFPLGIGLWTLDYFLSYSPFSFPIPYFPFPGLSLSKAPFSNIPFP
jgi:hypothetical protein